MVARNPFSQKNSQGVPRQQGHASGPNLRPDKQQAIAAWFSQFTDGSGGSFDEQSYVNRNPALRYGHQQHRLDKGVSGAQDEWDYEGAPGDTFEELAQEHGRTILSGGGARGLQRLDAPSDQDRGMTRYANRQNHQREERFTDEDAAGEVMDRFGNFLRESDMFGGSVVPVSTFASKTNYHEQSVAFMRGIVASLRTNRIPVKTETFSYSSLQKQLGDDFALLFKSDNIPLTFNEFSIPNVDNVKTYIVIYNNCMSVLEVELSITEKQVDSPIAAAMKRSGRRDIRIPENQARKIVRVAKLVVGKERIIEETIDANPLDNDDVGEIIFGEVLAIIHKLHNPKEYTDDPSGAEKPDNIATVENNAGNQSENNQHDLGLPRSDVG